MRQNLTLCIDRGKSHSTFSQADSGSCSKQYRILSEALLGGTTQSHLVNLLNIQH